MKSPEIDLLSDLCAARLAEPRSVLGPHVSDGVRTVTVFVPDAARVAALTDAARVELVPVDGTDGVFRGPVDGTYHLEATSPDGSVWQFEDPYRFPPVLSDFDRHLIGEGTHQQLWRVLGAHPVTHAGTAGVHFAVWAPQAQRVSVVGPFNGWDGRRHPMQRVGALWEIFLPGLSAGTVYKYEIIGADGTLLPPKADPVGFGSEHPPGNASVVRALPAYDWADAAWMDARARRDLRSEPVSIYEVHLGSWRRSAQGRAISYSEAAETLVQYAADMGFTHIELMPLHEHPFDGSWGYQPVGLYAPTVRHGPPEGLRALVDAAHGAGLGVILDWVPGHFPTDDHGLGRFDGTPLYEHADPREGFHPDWNTYIYNYGQREVAGHLAANARYWLQEYHFDGLRVDAVASMLYRDYSRAEGEWIPNRDGGRENYEAMAFLRAVTDMAQTTYPGSITVAEESTAFPGVTAPVDQGGLGFGFKWNMGWMHDTLSYLSLPPEHRAEHHHRMTFGLTYAFSEAFVLPISHDEVVHGKGSMLARVPGEGAARFAGLRAYYGFMWGHPGKKLLFMGQEFAQAAEWDHEAELDWGALERPLHEGVQRLVRDLNGIYRDLPALHAQDCDAAGFQWIEADDTARSVYAWIRRGGGGEAVVVCNFSDRAHGAYRLGLPQPGRWRVALSTDAVAYGGEGRDTGGTIEATDAPHQGQPASALLDLPPSATLILVPPGTD
ncbi:1,4-alpha-glucan branching protein GlgB [uncultured Roseobacter sp.]|uniref:1,4-alpha-glucan branching protein GlgB n=1 Tax=uncultured Roseobacter sp. TaxID=114847 RepID=UPI00261CA0D3|nr:1,4-alpha-glucan branching protein GlgB [uncultured Roseobacter sp.]